MDRVHGVEWSGVDINCQLSSIGFHFLCVLLSVKISKNTMSFMHFTDENFDKTLIFFTTLIDTLWRTWAYDLVTI